RCKDSEVRICNADFVREVSQATSDIWVVVYRNVTTILVYNNSVVKGTYIGSHHFGRRCTPEAVALVLCQSDHVLNDGQSSSESSRDAVFNQVRRNFIEKVVKEREDAYDGYNSN
ncbi:hypothetical protein MKX03_037716, partial [Papaver bracteatum]